MIGLWMRCLVVMLLALPAAAEEPPVEVTLADSAPWAWLPEGHRALPVGIWVDVNRELARRTGLDLKARLAPDPFIWRALQEGTTDLSYLPPAPDRDWFTVDAGRMFTAATVALARRGVDLDDVDDLADLRVARVRGEKLPGDVGGLAGTVVHVRDSEALMTALAEGRVDAVVGNSVALAYLAREMGLDARIGDRLVLASTPVAVLFAQRSDRLATADTIREAVAEMRAAGRFEAIVDHWAGPGWRAD